MSAYRDVLSTEASQQAGRYMREGEFRFLFLAVLLIVIFTACCHTATGCFVTLSPIVKTKSGAVQGKLVQDVYAFTGIFYAYAEPPIGQLRFQKPVPKTPWNDVFDATQPPKPCIQFHPDDSLQSEDCLILNIYVPRTTLDAVVKPPSQLAVYLFIHGGSYVGGWADPRYGNALSSLNNIIVATMQYRLGPLGFAYFGTASSSNFALWDQLEALKWINENIAAFGGNNQQITLGGQSTGAASVSYQLLSPHSRPYFQRAIIQAGSAISPWAQKQPNKAIEDTDTLFEKVSSIANCSDADRQSSIDDKLRCLRSADVEILVKSFGNQPLGAIAPIVDGDFIPRNPADIMLMSGDFSRVPLLIGFNREEGSGFLPERSAEVMKMLPSVSSSVADAYNALIEFGFNNQFDAAHLVALKQHYQPSSNELSHQSVIDAYVQLNGDLLFVCPTYVMANYTSAFNVPVFAYVFSQRETGKEDWVGATHGFELGYTLAPAILTSDAKDDELLSKSLMQYWGNFVKSGNPGQVTVQGCKSSTDVGEMIRSWPPYVGKQCSNQIVELNVETQVYACREAVTCHFKANDCSFWKDTFMH